jgi:hypothetical protein
LAGEVVIGSEVLGDLDGRIRHLTDGDHGCRGLGIDEIENVVEIGSDPRGRAYRRAG